MVPAFHMAAGSEQEEEDVVEHSDPSGRPGPTQSAGEGPRFCVATAEPWPWWAVCRARVSGYWPDLESLRRLPEGSQSCLGAAGTDAHYCRARRPDWWLLTGVSEETVREAFDQPRQVFLCALQSKETRSTPRLRGMSTASRAGSQQGPQRSAARCSLPRHPIDTPAADGGGTS